MNPPAPLPIASSREGRTIVNGRVIEPRPRRPRGRWIALGTSLLLFAVILAVTAWFAFRFDPLGRVQHAYEAHDYRAALSAAHDHLKRWPGDRRASLMTARCLARLGQWRQAGEIFSRFGGLSLDDANDHAYALTRLGAYDRALAAYEALLDRWPSDVLALKRTAALLMDRNDWKRVREIAQRLVKIPGGEIAGWTLSGIDFHVSKHAEEAIAAFEHVLEIDPDLEEMPLPRSLFWNHVALELMAVGRADDARRHLERELASHDDAGLRELLGVAHEKLGNPEEAERCWKAALAIDPNNTEAYIDLGRLALAHRRFDEAIPWLERAAELSPEAVDPVYNLGQVYRFKNDAAKARHYEALADARRRARPQRGGMGAMPASVDESGMNERAHEVPR